MKRPVYLDHHSTTPCDPAVVAAMLPYFTDHFGNPGAKSHLPGRTAAAVLETALEKIAAVVGATPETITLTSGATESNHLAIAGVAVAATDRREIIISAIEHGCVSAAAAQLAQNGFRVKTLPVTAGGFLLPETLAAAVGPETLLVSVIAASHEIGTMQDVRALCGIAHAAGALFHSDATQAVGKIPVDVAALGVDMLSYSAHKFYGPAGIGALYVRQKPPVPINRVMAGGAQQRLRPGSVPLALAAGFGAASDIATAALQAHIPRIAALTALLEQLLRQEIAGLEMNGGVPRLPGILNLRLPGVSAQDIMMATADDLAMSSGAACASARRAPSAVLQAIGLSAQQIDCCLRLTIGRGTTEEEIRFTARCLGDAVRKLARSAA